MAKRKNSSPYEKLRSANLLHNAWQQIYSNGLQSDSKDTRNEVRAFKKNERSYIDRIYRQIHNKKFAFKGNKGVTLGKKKRPIVLAPVESRIVQRAILDVLQDDPGIQVFLRSNGSYGAIKSFIDQRKGVPAAIKDIVQTIQDGADTYYKSDIASFFTKISRGKVIEAISAFIDDQDFLNILDQATNLEVENILSIPEEHRKFFDYQTVGTPQGCCLSPLLGNILLYEFDTEMNKGNLRCFRYLDDFIILGKGWKPVRGRFENAL
jgi:RNA-directed DNA polymerase